MLQSTVVIWSFDEMRQRINNNCSVRELLSKIEGDDDAEEEKLRVRHHLEFLLLCDKDDTYVRTYILCVWKKITLYTCQIVVS